MAVGEVCPIGLNLGTAHSSFADPKKAFLYPFIIFLKTSSRFLTVLIVDDFSDPEDILNLRSKFGILLIFCTSM
jgi:hypothetical protein